MHDENAPSAQGNPFAPEPAFSSCMITAFYEVTAFPSCMITAKGGCAGLCRASVCQTDGRPPSAPPDRGGTAGAVARGDAGCVPLSRGQAR
jgi:hypothetical protein